MQAYHDKGGVSYLKRLDADQFNALLKLLIPRDDKLSVSMVNSRDVAEQLTAMRERGGSDAR